MHPREISAPVPLIFEKLCHRRNVAIGQSEVALRTEPEEIFTLSVDASLHLDGHDGPNSYSSFPRTSHIATLPPELLRPILLLARPKFFPSHRFARTVGLVSRHWRAVALSIPELWSIIDLSDIQPQNVKSLPIMDQWINICIERSKNRHITLRLPKISHLLLSLQCLQSIADASARLTELEIPVYILNVLVAICPNLTKLKKLVVHLNTSILYLQRLTIQKLVKSILHPSSQPISHIGVPSQCITIAYFGIHALPMPITKTLGIMPKIANLTLDLKCTNLIPSSPACLPDLKYLGLISHFPKDVDTILHVLRLPGLEALKIERPAGFEGLMKLRIPIIKMVKASSLDPSRLKVWVNRLRTRLPAVLVDHYGSIIAYHTNPE